MGDASNGWHRRGYLPHIDAPGRTQGITFRLADSLPRHVIERWKYELRDLDEADRIEELKRRISRYEDAGRGGCQLREPAHARIVGGAIRHSDGERYDLIEWCVMPNHVHVLIRPRPGHPMEQIVRSWKSFTARRINSRAGRTGRLWAPDYHDRLIRDDGHLARARRYIRMNPVKAGLCDRPEDWPWGSAADFQEDG